MKRILYNAMLGVALVGLLVDQASAIPTLELYDGTTTVTVADGSAQDSNSAIGAVTFNGPIDGWTINVSTGITMPALGTSNNPQMDLNSVNVLSSGTGTLRIRFSETGFNSPIGGASVHTAIGGTTVGTVGYTTYFSNTNTLFATTTSLTALGPFTATSPGVSTAFSGQQTAGGAFVSPFSLTQVVTLAQGPGASSFDASLSVPEPTSLLLLGLGLVGLGLWKRKAFQS